MKLMNEEQILNQLGITRKDLEKIENFCNIADNNSEIGFPFKGMFISNIFYDTSARFEHSITDAVKLYGLENVRSFCKQVLSSMA